MDMRRLASYAYHNCEFSLAVEYALGSPPCEDLAAVHVKSLCELDDKQNAVGVGEHYIKLFPADGHLHYFLGMARYLAGEGKQAIEASFLSSVDSGFSGGAIGLAFLEAVEKRFDNALSLLRSATVEDGEIEHARRLALFQTLTLARQLDEAEAELLAADAVLSRSPSLLRQYWGQLCWVRLLRAKGRFDAAMALVERLITQLDESHAPRLHRNAVEARRAIGAKQCEPNLILPAAEGVKSKVERQGAIARITRKPMLHSLFVYLTARGRAGATKEDIVQNVWEESYNPLIHDDRIYKAIGRLRKLLDDDQQAPRYLTQMGRNYILNLPGDPPELSGD